MSGTRRWYVAHTQPQKEARAELNLRQQGFVTYLPRYKRTRRHARRTETVTRPLFPRYLFVALDIARDRWRFVQSTFGISNLILAGDLPAPLSEGVIDDIRQREDALGFVELGLPAGVVPGSTVKLLDGVFAEHTGVLSRIVDEYRVAVLLKLLGRDVRVFVPAASVSTI